MAKTLRELMAEDLNSLFFNLTEFAVKRVINNREMTVIIDEDRLMERTRKEYDGISVGELLFYVGAEEYGECPEQGAPLVFGGRQMYVFNARESDGVYEIILQQNRGA